MSFVSEPNAPPANAQLNASQAAWVQAALSAYRRYQTEVVEGWDLCPWAKRARLAGRVHEWVCLEAAPAPETVVAQLNVWEPQSDVEIGIMLFPRLEIARDAFEQFATQCMAKDAARHPLQSSEFVLAAFHPTATLALDTAERLVPFLRRSPDPTLQVVRVSALERVRRGEVSGTQFVDLSTLDLRTLKQDLGPSLRERVAAANLQTVERFGPQALGDLLGQIQTEREHAYAALPALGAQGDSLQEEG